MHDASLARTSAAVLIDCWTGLAPLVLLDGQSNASPARTDRARTALGGRLRRLLRLLA